MPVVPALDELEDGELRLGMRTEGRAIDEFTFECREEALAHRVVVAIADRPHRRTDTGLLAASPERDRGVLRAAVEEAFRLGSA